MHITPTEKEVRAFVGPNADYYLKVWRRTLVGGGGATVFNWAAFFFVGQWLGFRKMVVALLFLIGLHCTGAVLAGLSVEILGMHPKWLQALEALIWLILAVVCGVCGNRWYLSHALRVIAKVRSKGLAEDVHLVELAIRGGTSFQAALGVPFLYLLVGLTLIGLLQRLNEAMHGGGS